MTRTLYGEEGEEVEVDNIITAVGDTVEEVGDIMEQAGWIMMTGARDLESIWMGHQSE